MQYNDDHLLCIVPCVDLSNIYINMNIGVKVNIIAKVKVTSPILMYLRIFILYAATDRAQTCKHAFNKYGNLCAFLPPLLLYRDVAPTSSCCSYLIVAIQLLSR